MAAGLTFTDYLGYLKERSPAQSGKSDTDGAYGNSDAEARGSYTKKERAALKRISEMKPLALSPTTLLGGGAGGSASELKNPERHKLLHLFVGLIPTTLCMLFTVSMMITAKSGLDAGAVISGVVKLSTLPMIAMRGYSKGYDYSRLTLVTWLETKAKLLDAFLGEYNAAAQGV